MKIRTYLFTAVLLVMVCSVTTHAQFDILDKAKEKLKEKAEEAITKEDNESTEQKQEEPAQEEETQKAKTPDENPASKEEGLKSYSKFDFIPGDKLIFFEDFSQDNIGDFPAKWNTNGSGEVVTLNNYPGKWLKCKNGSLYVPEMPAPFPENYTVEFEVVYNSSNPDQTSVGNFNFALIASEGNKEYLQHAYVMQSVSPVNLYFDLGLFRSEPGRFHIATQDSKNGVSLSSDLNDNILNGKYGKIVKFAIAVQKTRVRLYCDGKKIFDLPKYVQPAIYDILKFGLWYFDDSVEDGYQFYLSNIRFAAGLPDMRSKLLTDGRLVTRGITFDVNSDKIKPESYGTLKEIAAVLKENPSVKVMIIGHTDSDGDETLNMELSKKRSAAVKIALTSEFGIDASRMSTDGKGESQPAVNNNTPEGKASNRRVEFVKM